MDTIATPQAAVPEPPSPQPQNFQQTMQNVDSTVNTATGTVANIGNRASSAITSVGKVDELWKGLLGWIFIIVLLAVIFWLFKGQLKKIFGSVWDFVSKPFKTLLAESKANDAGGRSMSQSELETMADNIYSCWSRVDLFEDDAAVEAYLLQLKLPGDWTYLCEVYGERNVKRIGSGNRLANLPSTIGSNLTHTRIQNVKAHLVNIGVSTDDEYYKQIVER